MAALTADRDTTMEIGAARSLRVKASTTIFVGSIVCLDATGFAVPGADTANYTFAGIARETVTTTATVSDSDRVEVDCSPGAVAHLAASGLAIADGGVQLYVSDDQTVAKSTTNSIKIGKLAYFESAAVAPVLLAPLS